MSENLPLGRMSELVVNEITDQGAFVDGKAYGALFVPRRQLPEGLKIGDKLRVFLYVDGTRVYATARHPYLEAGMVGARNGVSIECGTAYMNLGIPKDQGVPVSEQRTGFEVGRRAVVYVTVDGQGRLFGTQRLNSYLKDKAPSGRYKTGDQVTVVPVARTPLGFRVAVDDEFYGLIYLSEQKGAISLGKRYQGWILNVRDDGRLDVTLQETGRRGIEHAAFDILKALHHSGGKLPFGDKSDPAAIEDYLHMSKARFKKAIGHLYKERLIEIRPDGIAITPKGEEDYARFHPESAAADGAGAD